MTKDALSNGDQGVQRFVTEDGTRLVSFSPVGTSVYPLDAELLRSALAAGWFTEQQVQALTEKHFGADNARAQQSKPVGIGTGQ